MVPSGPAIIQQADLASCQLNCERKQGEKVSRTAELLSTHHVIGPAEVVAVFPSNILPVVPRAVSRRGRGWLGRVVPLADIPVALLALARVPLVTVMVQDGAALVGLTAPVSERHRPAVCPFPGVLRKRNVRATHCILLSSAYLLLLHAQPDIILVFLVGQQNTDILL